MFIALHIRNSLMFELNTSQSYWLLSFLLQAVCLQRPVIYSSLNIYFYIPVIILTLFWVFFLAKSILGLFL